MFSTFEHPGHLATASSTAATPPVDLVHQLTEQEMLPFAIVGSEKSVVIDGKPVRGRKNRWGVINVEDERHCEFVYLRNFLTRYVFFFFKGEQ